LVSNVFYQFYDVQLLFHSFSSEVIQLLKLLLLWPNLRWKTCAEWVCEKEAEVIFFVKFYRSMDIKFFLNLRRKRFDFDVLPRVISKESRVPSSSYEKFFSYFKHIALFWNWIDQKPKQKHHDICDSTQLTQQIKPTKNSSRILVNLGSKSKFNWKQSWRIDLSTLVCLDPINDLEVASSDDPIIENLQKSVFQLKILLSHEELIGDNHVTFQVSLRYKFHNNR